VCAECYSRMNRVLGGLRQIHSWRFGSLQDLGVNGKIVAGRLSSKVATQPIGAPRSCAIFAGSENRGLIYQEPIGVP